MDDVTDSFPQKDKATEAINQVDKILERGSFEIKEWHSNSPDVDGCPAINETQVSGYVRNTSVDTIYIQFDRIDESFDEMTKRKAAGIVAKLSSRHVVTHYNQI